MTARDMISIRIKVRRDEISLPARLAAMLLSYAVTSRDLRRSRPGYLNLSVKERQLLRALVDSGNIADFATVINFSQRTTSHFTANILGNLHVTYRL